MPKYSTLFFFLLFSTPLLLMFLSTILLPPPGFVFVHSSMFPFPLLFTIVFQLHSLHSYCYEFQNFENAHNFQQQCKLFFTITPFFLILEHLALHSHSFIHSSSFNLLMILEINTAHHYEFMCPLYHHMEVFSIIIMNELTYFIF